MDAETESTPSKPGYSSLRRHRWSGGGVEYFVTINLQRPASGLHGTLLFAKVRDAWMKLETETAWNIRTAVVMSDHIHLLFTLGQKVGLAECLRLFKGHLSPALRAAQLSWQEGYYEHRLRADDDRLPIFLYIYLNPYRANLTPVSEKWPAYYCSPDDYVWFAPLTDSNLPFPEWLR